MKVHRSNILQVRYDEITQTGSDPVRSLSQYASRTSRVCAALCVRVHYVDSCLKRWRSGSAGRDGIPNLSTSFWTSGTLNAVVETYCSLIHYTTRFRVSEFRMLHECDYSGSMFSRTEPYESLYALFVTCCFRLRTRLPVRFQRWLQGIVISRTLMGSWL